MKLKLSIVNADDDDGQATATKSVEKTVEKIKSSVRKNPTITIRELMEIVGLSRRGVEEQIKSMKAQGIIRHVGPDKGGHWEIIAPDIKIKKLRKREHQTS